MTLLWIEVDFTATHQIRIAGELETVHGHDFRARAEIEGDEDRDAVTLRPLLERVVAPLRHTRLGDVERREGGCASAERIARYVYERLREEIRAFDGLRVRRATITEAPGCRAGYAGTVTSSA